MYRPDGWENPYGMVIKAYQGDVPVYSWYPGDTDCVDEKEYKAFEAGADAYEEGLKKEGHHVSGVLHSSNAIRGVINQSLGASAGTWVFIPDEVKDEKIL